MGMLHCTPADSTASDHDSFHQYHPGTMKIPAVNRSRERVMIQARTTIITTLQALTASIKFHALLSTTFEYEKKIYISAAPGKGWFERLILLRSILTCHRHVFALPTHYLSALSIGEAVVHDDD